MLFSVLFQNSGSHCMAASTGSRALAGKTWLFHFSCFLRVKQNYVVAGWPDYYKVLQLYLTYLREVQTHVKHGLGR